MTKKSQTKKTVTIVTMFGKVEVSVEDSGLLDSELCYGEEDADSASTDDVLNACINYVVHREANFDGMPEGLVEYFKEKVDERLYQQ